MSEEKNQGGKFDLRAALSAQAQEQARQNQEHAQYQQILKSEHVRLTSELFHQIKKRLEGIREISVDLFQEPSLPSQSVRITYGDIKYIFDPIDYRGSSGGGYRGRLVLRSGPGDFTNSIVFLGGKEGSWRLGIADSSTQLQAEELTDKTLDSMLGRLMGLSYLERDFDLRIALTQRTQERERQKQERERYLAIKEQEYSRLTTDLYQRINNALEGVKEIDIRQIRDPSLPCQSLVMTRGSTVIRFSPKDNQYYSTRYKGVVDIKVNNLGSNFQIVFIGGQDGGWQLGISDTSTHQEAVTLTDQSLELLLGNLLGVIPPQ